MTTYAHEDLQRILDAHRKWLLGEEGGSRANLRGANLRGADLSRADLRRADLSRADLRRADLSRADLRRADLSGANLSRADLRGATLRGTNLSGDTVLTDGVTWGEYLRDVVPALLCAGGKPLAAVASPETWACHSWTNCPMATAFDVQDLNGVPVLYRWQAERFVQFYDAGLIPLPASDSPTRSAV
jgi:hypothetical protein